MSLQAYFERTQRTFLRRSHTDESTVPNTVARAQVLQLLAGTDVLHPGVRQGLSKDANYTDKLVEKAGSLLQLEIYLDGIADSGKTSLTKMVNLFCCCGEWHPGFYAYN